MIKALMVARNIYNRKLLLYSCMTLFMLSSTAYAQPQLPDFSSLPPIDGLPVIPLPESDKNEKENPASSTEIIPPIPLPPENKTSESEVSAIPPAPAPETNTKSLRDNNVVWSPPDLGGSITADIPALPPLPGASAAPVIPSIPSIEKAATETEKPLAPIPEMEPLAPPPIASIAEKSEDELPPIVMPNAPALPPIAASEDFQIPELPDIPDFSNPIPTPPSAAPSTAPSLPAISAEAPTIASNSPANELEAPTLSDLPDFTDITEPEGTSKPNTEAAITPPAPPPVAPLPMPSLPAIANNKPETETSADKETEILPTIADLLNEENSKEGDNKSNETAIADKLKKAASNNAKTADSSKKSKELLWPRSFKTQILPPQIYSKAYPGNNNHLPKATYYQEIEAHLFQAVASNNLNGIRALLSTGVPLIIRSPEGETLLSHAIRAGAYDAARLLLALRVNPNEANPDGSTPLHYAAYSGQIAIAQALIYAGANPNTVDSRGITPLQLAQNRGDMAMLNLLGYSRFNDRNAQQKDYATYMR